MLTIEDKRTIEKICGSEKLQLMYFLQHGAAGTSNAAVERDAVHDGQDVFGEEV